MSVDKDLLYHHFKSEAIFNKFDYTEKCYLIFFENLFLIYKFIAALTISWWTYCIYLLTLLIPYTTRKALIRQFLWLSG